jgi:hypothetical protein
MGSRPHRHSFPTAQYKTCRLSGKSVRLFGIMSHDAGSERSNPAAPKIEICLLFQADLGRPVRAQKIFRFASFAGFLVASRLTERGVRAIVTTREAGMRWTLSRQALLRETTGEMADGEVVWSWRPKAGATRAMMLHITHATVTTKSGHRGATVK